MIPFIRSVTELMLITQSRDRFMNASKKDEVHYSTVDSGQRKRYIRSVSKKEIILPDVHKAKRRRWIKGKEYMSRFFDNLDYNNQIQSSYDLTLLARQNNINHRDAA